MLRRRMSGGWLSRCGEGVGGAGRGWEGFETCRLGYMV